MFSFRQNLRRVLTLCVSLMIIGGSVEAAESTPNLFLLLKDFFQASIGSKVFVQPDRFIKPIPSAEQQATWYDRAMARNLWRDHYVVKKDLLDVILDSNGDASDVIGISAGAAGLDPTNPDVAFDPTNNRYLVVWEEETEPGVFNILGQFRDINGTAVGSPATISSPRTAQGCFYAAFDSDNGDISTPNNCPAARNPAVAFNNGRYLVAWELQGRAEAATNYNGEQNDAGKDFSNIIVKVLRANDLASASGAWDEGIMISKAWTASNVSTPAVSDGQVQAWGRSINPDVAPKLGGDGFVVTWETNKDFIGCVDPNRRDASSVYGRYVDQNFSPTGEGNKPLFAVYTDPSTATSTCPTLDNVMRANKPRIAFNSARSDFVVAFEFVRAGSATQGDIGGKKIVLSGANDATVTNSMAPEMLADANDGTTFQNPDVASFNNRVFLVYDNGSAISARKLTTAGGEVAPDGNAVDLTLSGTGSKREPRWASNLGIGGTRPASSSDPERLAVAYRQGSNTLRAAVVDDTFTVTNGPLDVSNSMTTGNHVAEVASDFKDFFVVWAGVPQGMTSDQVFAAKVASAGNTPPTGPVLAAQPADGVTWAPTRLYLSWTASTDPDPGNTIVYDVYFAQGATSGAAPYKSGLTTTEFVIQASTDNRAEFNPDGGVTPVFLAASSSYKWKICARDNNGGTTCSSERTFNTDNSVKGWWRFDENPAGPVCAGGAAGESVCDSSGNNNHGIPSGGPTWVAAAPDILGRALGFDGTNDYVSVQNTSSLNPNSVSVIAIFKTNGDVGPQQIVDKRNMGAGYNLRVQGGAYPLQLDWVISESDETNHELVAGSIANSTRYHVVSTFDSASSEAKSYANGAISGTINFGALNRTTKSTASLLFGEDAYNTPPSMFNYKGNIDEVIILDRALPVEEVSNNNDSSN